MRRWKQMVFAACCMAFATQLWNPVYAETQLTVKEEAPLYYSSSTSVDSAFETFLVAELKKQKKEIDIAKYGIDKEDALETFVAVIHKNPELYFVKKSLQYSYSPSTGRVTKIVVTYRNYNLDAVEAEINKIVDLVNDEMTDLEKIITIHDYLCLTIEYPQSDLINNRVSDDAHTIKGAVIDKIAVCDGYSTAFQYVMEKLGIDCTLVTGTGNGGSHAWNQVKLDGKWYLIDVSWDDLTFDNLGGIKHEHMLKSESDFAGHSWTKTDYERCTSTTYDNAFWADSNTLLLDYNNYWYYLDLEGVLRKHSLKDINAAGTKIATLGGKWYVHGSTSSFYKGNYAKLAMHNGKIYYSQPEGIYTIGFDGKNQKLFSSVDTTKGYIYGMKIEDNKIYYQISKVANEEERTNYYLELESTPATQKITTGADSYKKVYGDESFSLSAKTSGDGKLTFTSSNTKVATVAYDGKVYIKGVGTTKITIRAAATDSSKAATKTVEITVGRKKLDGKIKIPTSKYAYNGKAKQPTVTVKGYKMNVDYKVTYSNNVNMGTGKITVTGIGNYTGTITRNFYIVPRQTKIVSADATGSRRIKVAWEKQNFTGYEIYICQRKDFSKGYKKIMVTNPSTLSKSITGLTTGKTYYVRVRAYKTISGKAYQGIFSEILTVKVK